MKQSKQTGDAEYDIIIVGGGPTGLMLAGELALAGVNVALIERRASQELDGSRAKGIHARAIEVLDQRGIADRFVEAGQKYPFVGFAQSRLDISDFPSRHNYLLGLNQSQFEPILAEWVADLDVTHMRNCEVTGFMQDDTGVTATLADGTSLRAAYLVGCDGGRSLVRKAADIGFPGLDASASWLIAEARMTDTPPIGMRPEGGGIGPVNPGHPDTAYGITLQEQQVGRTADPTLEDLKQVLVEAYGSDFGVHSPTWISHFTDATRQADTYRKGRVLLAGDAAHIHPPQGGQGLGLGIQDAVNLGWKLAQVVKGISPDTLLDTYHAERYPVGARVLRTTMAQVALLTPDKRHDALREIATELFGLEESRRYIVGMMSGLDIRYDLGEGHPLLGRRMPDLDIQTANGSMRVYELLHDAKPVLLSFDTATSFDISPWADRVTSLAAQYDGAWELPVIGAVAAPRAVLVRPDGYVAWVGSPDSPDPAAALARWFGAPATA